MLKILFVNLFMDIMLPIWLNGSMWVHQPLGSKIIMGARKVSKVIENIKYSRYVFVLQFEVMIIIPSCVVMLM
jgi:hypothetical protein